MSYKLGKRIIDIIISSTAIIILVPVFLIVGICIRLNSPGPIIFKQKRLGVNGKEFIMYKFRSMCLNAEEQGVYELKGDYRVTRVGKFIRKASIDELPQLLNILKGDMSIVGPRPVLIYHPWPYEKYTKEQKKMFEVKPGLTGWAQVNGRKEVEWNRRIQLNIYYVENMSIIFDVKIIWMTLFKVLKMENNYNKNISMKK